MAFHGTSTPEPPDWPRPPDDLAATVGGLPVSPGHKPETGMAHDWPLASFLELSAHPEAVRSARSHVRQVLSDWELDYRREHVALVISELATNAVRASRALTETTPVRLWLFSDKDKILIMVWDASPCPVSPPRAGEELGENGRGLLLVDAISTRWSWYYTAETAGKVVWSLCSGTEPST